MASTDFFGAGGTHSDGYESISDCWHLGPTMGASGTLSGTRNGSTISGTVVAECYRPHGTYNYPVYVRIYSNGTLIKDEATSIASGGTQSETIDWSVETNEATTISVEYVCGQSGGCTKTTYGLENNTIYFSAYNPETPAKNASAGKIYSTNHTGGSQGGNISDKPDLEVWWSWTGATSGTPSSKNGIKQYNIDIATTNNKDSATSISITQNYTKNKHISLFTLCRNYGVRVGGTLYCWVNTQINSGSWLRKGIFRFYNNEKRWFYKI